MCLWEAEGFVYKFDNILLVYMFVARDFQGHSTGDLDLTPVLNHKGKKLIFEKLHSHVYHFKVLVYNDDHIF